MKIMVSACLLGDNCKYNGGNNYQEELNRYLDNHEVYKVCPEIMGGLPVPRVPSEIKGEMVINKDNVDVTKEYHKGALKTLEIALKNNIKVAILKDRSPSCGSTSIYDGTFSKKVISGEGITTKLLRENGITVLNENNYQDYIGEDNGSKSFYGN